ncbi:MAG: ATP-binding protein, partial [Aggregatilineales bacterium]
GSHKGTGLGLSIVKRVLDWHRGTIVVTSEVDAGTSFQVQLPLSRLL